MRKESRELLTKHIGLRVKTPWQQIMLERLEKDHYARYDKIKATELLYADLCDGGWADLASGLVRGVYD